MKIALAQLDFHVGNFERNKDKMLLALAEAKEKGADIVVFAELAVCGYPPRDFLEFPHFLHLCYQAVDAIAEASRGIASVIGAPSPNPVVEGKDLYNAAYFCYDGKVQHVVHKALLPTYDVFDEYRYFEPGSSFNCINYKGEKIALTVCEDIWNLDENPLYVLDPMHELAKQQATLAINIAASPFSYGHDERRTAVVAQNAKMYGIPFFYVNHTGAQTELIFDGGSMAASPTGEIIKLPYFQEKLEVVDAATLSTVKTKYAPPDKNYIILQALKEGVGDYFEKLGFQHATLGLSGGLDSALVYAIAVLALGKENVHPVLLPSPYSSHGSVEHSLEMIRRCGTDYHKLEIGSIMNEFDKTLQPCFTGLANDVTEENIQARIRGTLLMALTNKLKYILLNTSNKSEMAVGYSTLYGDSAGAICVIGDLYKTEAYELAEYINRAHGDLIPKNIINKAPSAELRPDQKDSDSLPPYPILDKILYQYIEQRKGPQAIISENQYPEELVLSICKLVNRSEFKRQQAPPVLRVSDKAFGMGRRLPIVAKYLG